MAVPTNHNTDLTIGEMVFNRLTFLNSSDPATETIVSEFIFEIMWDLEACFKIKEATTPSDDLNVGDEQYYSMVQKMIIADLTAVYILMQVGAAISGGSSTISAGGTYLKKAKAGSVEVEWDQSGSSSSVGGLEINSSGLIDKYTKSAVRRAQGLGCIIDLCDGCSLSVMLAHSSFDVPFKVVKSSDDCGCS